MRIPLQLEEFLHRVIGLDVEAIGVSSVERAMRGRMAARGMALEADYLRLLAESEAEREELIERIVVPETWFFRDEKPFRLLQQYVVEEWLPARPSTPLRLLSLPCSTGEEPYSMAMALFDVGLSPRHLHIDAYDISHSALAKARRGVYGRNSFRSAEVSFRERYFRATFAGFELDETARQAVTFSHGNILDPAFPHAKDPYQVIFFRNLMIYLGRDPQTRALAAIERLLDPAGLLFIGHAEATPLLDQWFSSVRYPFAFAYRKRSDERRLTRLQTSPVLERRRPVPDAGVTTDRGAGRSSRRSGFSPTSPAEAGPARPPEPPDPLEQARRLADQGRLEEARRFCEAALREQGPKAQAYYLLGLIHDAGGDGETAEQCFSRAVYLEPVHGQALLHLALAAERRGDLRAAGRFRQRARAAGFVEEAP